MDVQYQAPAAVGTDIVWLFNLHPRILMLSSIVVSHWQSWALVRLFAAATCNILVLYVAD